MLFSNSFVSIAAAGLLLNAGMSYAHGIVSDMKIGENWIKGSLPYQDPYQNPVPKRATWPFFGIGNGPIEDVSSKDITCNRLTGKGELTAEAKAGEKVTFYWTEWPESHRGPAMTYLANCGDKPCSEVSDPSSLSFFKIDEAGWLGDRWASDKLIAENSTWTITIPEDIAPGYYMMRHELLALHSAHQMNGAQFYPSCTNLKITGNGNARPEGVKFPGAYKNTDKGIYVNIYSNFKGEDYVIPGPPVYKAGGDSGNSPAPSPSKTSSSSDSAPAPTTFSFATSSTKAPEVTQAPGNPEPTEGPSVETKTYYNGNDYVVLVQNVKYVTKVEYKTVYA